MEQKTIFIIDNLEKKSNAILGFIVVQSIFLADRLSNNDFREKIMAIKGLNMYILVGHCLIMAFAIVFLLMIDQRIAKNLPIDIRKVTLPRLTLGIKIALTFIFGLIPVIVSIHQMSQ